MAKRYTVFTYGSLMQGFYGYKTLMKDAKFIDEATVEGDLRFFCSDYPVMIKNTKRGKPVKGELYSVDEKTMDELRKYEGIGNPFTCYTEQVIKADTDHGTVVARAFVVIPSIKIPMVFTSSHIPEADWREFSTSGKRQPIPRPLMLFAGVFLAGVAAYSYIHQIGHI